MLYKSYIVLVNVTFQHKSEAQFAVLWSRGLVSSPHCTDSMWRPTFNLTFTYCLIHSSFLQGYPGLPLGMKATGHRPKLNLRIPRPFKPVRDMCQERTGQKTGENMNGPGRSRNCPGFSPKSASCFLYLASALNWEPCLGSFLALLANSPDFSQLLFNGCSNQAVTL